MENYQTNFVFNGIIVLVYICNLKLMVLIFSRQYTNIFFKLNHHLVLLYLSKAVKHHFYDINFIIKVMLYISTSNRVLIIYTYLITINYTICWSEVCFSCHLSNQQLYNICNHVITCTDQWISKLHWSLVLIYNNTVKAWCKCLHNIVIRVIVRRHNLSSLKRV